MCAQIWCELECAAMQRLSCMREYMQAGASRSICKCMFVCIHAHIKCRGKKTTRCQKIEE